MGLPENILIPLLYSQMLDFTNLINSCSKFRKYQKYKINNYLTLISHFNIQKHLDNYKLSEILKLQIGIPENMMSQKFIINLSKFKSLKKLILYSSHFYITKSSETLEYLCGGRMTDIVHLPNLKYLELQKNDFIELDDLKCYDIEEIHNYNTYRHKDLDLSRYKKLKKISFAYSFNKHIFNLESLPNLEHLRFGECFNQNIMVLSKLPKLKSLHLPMTFRYEIPNLNLEELSIGDINNIDIKNVQNLETIKLPMLENPLYKLKSLKVYTNITYLNSVDMKYLECLSLELKTYENFDIIKILILKNLTKLEIKGTNNIDNIKYLCEFKRLNYLDILNDQIPVLNKLETLKICNETMIDIKNIIKFPNLKELYINHILTYDLMLLLEEDINIYIKNKNISMNRFKKLPFSSLNFF